MAELEGAAQSCWSLTACMTGAISLSQPSATGPRLVQNGRLPRSDARAALARKEAGNAQSTPPPAQRIGYETQKEHRRPPHPDEWVIWTPLDEKPGNLIDPRRRVTWCFLPDTASPLCSGGGGRRPDMGLDLAEPGFASACFVSGRIPPMSSSPHIPQRADLRPAPIWGQRQTGIAVRREDR